jgi:cytoskeletal protein CcmA (bactofilin family)
MAIFNQSSSAKRESAPQPQESALKKEPDRANELSFAAPPPAAAPAPASTPRTAERADRGDSLKESLIAADLTIEGKIEGAGHIRLAGRFKGDVHVQGDLTIEHGAKLTGGVRARKVMVAGELEGNIESAQRLELLESGVLVGDVKAGSVVVASGSRMRGQVEFGWEDNPKASGRTEAGGTP